MRWSLTVGTFKGTVVRLHVTFLLFLLWIGSSAYARGGAQAAVAGLVFMALLFLCVLLHEFGHVLAARRFGVRTPDVTLLPIGGVARLERIPEAPGQELAIALAGPAVNVAIAAGLYLLLDGLVPARGFELANPGVDMLVRLFAANLFLVAFNLLPVFPMDGGRVLRALLACRLGHARATRVAARLGQVLAVLLGGLGLAAGNLILTLVAVVVFLAAGAEARAVRAREAARRAAEGGPWSRPGGQPLGLRASAQASSTSAVQ